MTLELGTIQFNAMELGTIQNETLELGTIQFFGIGIRHQRQMNVV